MDRASKEWIREYKKLFDEVARFNAGMNATANMIADRSVLAIERIGRVDDAGVADNVGRSSIDSVNKTKITADMSESERASVLRNRTLNVPIYKGQADSVIEDVKRNYESKKKEFGKKAVVEIAEKLGIIHESINFKDVDVRIELSNRNLKESITKDATPEQVAKLLPILSETAKSAVAIERHDNRYYNDSDTVYFDNLVGAYVDDGNVVPVRFGLKYSRTGKTTLYVVVDQNKIPVEKLTEIKKTEVIATNGPDKSATEDHLNSVIYSISQILSFVNSKDLLRYIPNDFISSEQIRAKREAIAETQEYTDKKNDKNYSDFVKQGNLRAAKDMLSAKAKAAGYTSELYSNTPNNIKTAEITYDDEGKLIPISKRYDKNNPDARYALSDGTKVTSTDVAKVKKSTKQNINGHRLKIGDLFSYSIILFAISQISSAVLSMPRVDELIAKS